MGVHFKWLGTEGHDREVVFVNGQHEGKIHTLLAAGDVPLMPAGKRMSLAPDSFLVKSAARYPITEAGMGASIDRISALQAALEHGDKSRDTLTDLGVQNRADYKDWPAASHRTRYSAQRRAGDASRWQTLVWLRHEIQAPPPCSSVSTTRAKKTEYYRYDRVMLAHLDDDDFNPEKMGGFPW